MATFPLPFRPKEDYHQGGIRFGDDRTDVMHGACDLIAPVPTEVYAVEDGIVLSGARQFFESGPHVKNTETGKWVCVPPKLVLNPKTKKMEEVSQCLWVYELIIQHKTFLARYGEIAAALPPDIRPNATVVEGQLIAYVGKQAIKSMLHFEMFSDRNDTSNTTVFHNMTYINVPKPRVTYHRRKDLMDPTAYLDSCDVQVERPIKN